MKNAPNADGKHLILIIFQGMDTSGKDGTIRHGLYLLSLAFFLLPLLGFAQKDGTMLISQIDGNRYYRKNYNKSGKLISYQTLEVGSLTINNEKTEAKLTVITYDENGNMKGASQTIISCDPEANEVLMGIFPFAGGATNKSLKIELPKNKKPYPKGWENSVALENYTYNLKFKGGAAGFFGTESQVSFSDRKVSKPQDGVFRISGKMVFKAFILGISISTSTYEYQEDLKKGIGITRQKFTEDNGNYFTIELKE